MSCTGKSAILILALIIALSHETNHNPEIKSKPEFYDYKAHKWVYGDSANLYKMDPNTRLYIPIDSMIDTEQRVIFKGISMDTVVNFVTEDEVIDIIENQKY